MSRVNRAVSKSGMVDRLQPAGRQQRPGHATDIS
jgi:hypothetical protein